MHGFKYQMSWQASLDKASLAIVVLLSFFLPVSTAGVNIAFYLLLAFYLLSGNWQKKWQHLRDNKFIRITVLLFILIWLSTGYGVADWHVAASQASKYNKLLIIPIILYQVKDRKWLMACLWGLLAGCLLTFIFGSLKYYFNLNPFGLGDTPASPFIQHIGANFIMAFATVVTYFLAWHHPGRFKKLLLALLALAFLHYTLFMNISRSGYVVLAAATLALALFDLKHKNYKRSGMTIGLLIVAFVTAFTFSTTFTQRFSEAESNISAYHEGNADTSVGARLSFYQNSLALFKKTPFFGVGMGSFQTEYNHYVLAHHNRITTANPHNQYLDILTQMGIIGFIVLGLFYLIGYLTRQRNPLQAMLANTMMLSFLSGSAINSWLMDFQPGFLFCLILALATCYCDPTNATKQDA